MLAAATVPAIRAVLDDVNLGGVYHMTAGGRTTWYKFAREIFDASGIGADIVPVASGDYPTLARRPQNSVLDNSKLVARFGIRLPAWQEGMGEVLNQLRARADDAFPSRSPG